MKNTAFGMTRRLRMLLLVLLASVARDEVKKVVVRTWTGCSLSGDGLACSMLVHEIADSAEKMKRTSVFSGILSRNPGGTHWDSFADRFADAALVLVAVLVVPAVALP